MCCFLTLLLAAWLYCSLLLSSVESLQRERRRRKKNESTRRRNSSRRKEGRKESREKRVAQSTATHQLSREQSIELEQRAERSHQRTLEEEEERGREPQARLRQRWLSGPPAVVDRSSHCVGSHSRLLVAWLRFSAGSAPLCSARSSHCRSAGPELLPSSSYLLPRCCF